MAHTNYLQVVRLTWEERFNMYMKRPKRELASMLAERDKHDFPDGCKECEKVSPDIITQNKYASTSTDNGTEKKWRGTDTD